METNQKELIRKRIAAELEFLSSNGDIKAELIEGPSEDFVIFYNLETSGGVKNLPTFSDVVVAVPANYPTSPIDMPALPIKSELIPFVVGGTNPQGVCTVLDKEWRHLSFHPYSGAGAPQWNPNKHGFHDYYHHLVTWLNRI